MKTIIPFAGKVDEQEKKQWIEAINEISDKFTLVPLDDLTDADKSTAQVAIVANPDATELETLPQLKWLQSLWAGVDGLLASKIKPDIEIVRLTDPEMAETMSEAVLAWSLYLHRNMPAYNTLSRNQVWRTLPLKKPQDCRISIFGLGKLGSRAAQRLQQNNFAVQGWSNTHKNIDKIDTFAGAAGLQQILPITDIAVILLPRTADTESLFNKHLLQQLPSGSSIINFARGQIIVDDDLLTQLDSGHIDHAVLDVFHQEPLPSTHPFWSHQSVTVLPHISAPTTIDTAAKLAANNIDTFLRTGAIPDSVDRSKGY